MFSQARPIPNLGLGTFRGSAFIGRQCKEYETGAFGSLVRLQCGPMSVCARRSMSQASSKDVFNILKIVVVRLFAVVALISNTRAWSFLVKQKAFTFCQAYGGAPLLVSMCQRAFCINVRLIWACVELRGERIFGALCWLVWRQQ